MRSDMRLEATVFQLTPTRTRCDLVIVANGKTEKIASGLLNPFLSHLKTARDQIGKGGYSIKLVPDPAAEAAWFTKDTVERFVRFVSTPEVLERVNTIESEILQIEDAISIQGNGNLGISTVEEHHHAKPIGSSEGSKPVLDPDADKAIVLYKPGSHANTPEPNGSKTNEESSKVQLVRVLESRKKVLQKEQAMAFARAAAAGFDVDNMGDLISFAESFGALRLKEACIRYIELWKCKHESGQWIEVEAAEAVSYRSEFSPLNTSGIILSGDEVRQKEVETWSVSGGETSMEGKANHINLDNGRDKSLPSEHQATNGQSEYYHGQFQHPSIPQWPIHPQLGPHMFQPYPLQAMPYYQNYPVNGQLFQAPPPTMHDPRSMHQRKGKKKHSRSKVSTSTSGDSSQGTSESESDEEPLRGHGSHQKVSRSGKKKGVVVIRNLNYIAGRGPETTGNGSESAPDPELEEGKDSLSENEERKHKPSSSSKKKDNHSRNMDIASVDRNEVQLPLQEADAGNWQAFQSFLLRAEEKMVNSKTGDIFDGEKEPSLKKGQYKGEHDLIILPERHSGDYHKETIVGYDSMNGKGNRTKKAVSTDEFLVSSDCRGLGDNHTYAHSGDTEGINGGGKISRNDDFIIYRQEKQMDNKTTSDLLVFCEHEHGGNSENSSSHYVTDESFMVPVRSGSQDLVGADRRLTIDMDTEFPSAPQRNEDSLNKATTRIEYEPDDLTLMLERAKVNETIAYGSAADYDIQAPLVIKQEAKKEENGVVLTTNEELMKTGLEKKLKTPQRGLSNKMKDTTTRKMASSRATPLNEAQKRAEKLRSYKADLQKLKKEQEEEEIQRLEALKRERQKRIAARNDANSAKSSASPQQSKSRFPGNVLPIAYKSSKFMDSDHRTNLPLPKVPIKTTSIGSNESGKANSNSRSNGLSRTASLLRETKNENKLEGNQLSARIRKLSEPKGGAVSRKKGSFNQAVVNKTVAQEPHSKKVSAIIQLDRTKSETLPELKITAYRNPSEPIQSKSAVKEQKLAGSKTMISENINTEKNTNASPNCNYVDENLVVEKTVLMLENKVVPDPAVQTSDMKIEEDKFYGDINRDRPVLDTEYAAIDAPTSSSYRGEIENPSRGSQDDQLNYYENSYEIVDDFSKDEPRSVLDPTVTEKACSTPSARDSSLEETLPGHSNEEHVKPRNKESKGFRKLWKFGRKGHHGYASGDGNLDSEGIADDHMVATSSNDVSRPFSIFSTLRGKNNEKRIAALA